MQVAPSRAASRGPTPSEPVERVDARAGRAIASGVALGDTDEPQAELLVLPGLGHRRRLEHQVACPDWVLGKAMTSRMFVCSAKQRRPAIDAEGDPAVRRRAVLEGVEDGPELLVHRPRASGPGAGSERSSRSRRWIRIGPATQLPAVERQVVLEGPGTAGRIVRRRASPGRRTP